jgi:hypothetical protein
VDDDIFEGWQRFFCDEVTEAIHVVVSVGDDHCSAVVIDGQGGYACGVVGMGFDDFCVFVPVVSNM